MSNDDRKRGEDASQRNDEQRLENLPAKPVVERAAGEVKGGFSKNTDKASPT